MAPCEPAVPPARVPASRPASPQGGSAGDPQRPDEVAEWLRRWTANPLCSARVGSNPILVVVHLSESHSFYNPKTKIFVVTLLSA